VERLAKRIEENIPDVIALTGGMGIINIFTEWIRNP
jgi:hypothetical protein